MSTLNHAAHGMRVCIDLGTALSKASVYLGTGLPATESVAPLPLGTASRAEHALLTPSAMYVDDGKIYFGPTAIESARAAGESKRLPILSFKMILSAREIEPTLALKLSRAVDPSGSFCHRDALVLYLAYLDQLIRAAVSAEPNIPAAAADAPRRITSPVWRSRTDIAATVGRLIEESSTVSAQLGAMLLSPSGISVGEVKSALMRAAAQPSAGRFSGVVFEAQSAAAAYLALAASRAKHVLVIDMGAGTTDLAGFERSSDDAPVLNEISEARQWCALAGDELDGIIIDSFMRASGVRGRDDEARLWRALRLSTHRLKVSLFSKGKATFEFNRKKITVSLNALQRDPAFRALCRALVKVFATGMKPVAERAKRSRDPKVCVLLAGGGAGLPFMAELVKIAARLNKGVTAEIEPFGANWALPYRYHPFAGSFPQMAISIGGALAQLHAEPILATATA